MSYANEPTYRSEAGAKIGLGPPSQPPQQVLEHIMQRLAETHAHLMENNSRLRGLGDTLLGANPETADSANKVGNPNGKIATLEHLALMLQVGVTENRHQISRLEVL